jgi:threonine dehydratase
MITRRHISQAYTLISGQLRRTPVIDVEGLGGGLPVTLKLETFQHTGSFKPRGAFANLIGRAVPSAGVVAASGGNHGAAVAYAASRLGVPATIFVPQVVSPAKAERIASYGARLVVDGKRYAHALAASETFVEETGALAIHAYDQAETLIGQGTLGLEMGQDLPEVDTVLVAVGGGGQIGGIAAGFAGAKRIIAVEPESAPTLRMAFEAGQPVDAPAGGIAADSLAPRQVGSLMFPIAQLHVDRSVLVGDDDIRRAQAALWEVTHLVTEPGGATAFAALLSGKYVPVPSEKVCVLVCGANTDAVRYG